ncbi:helicase-associated domain-containing protein [Cohnella sp. WQ 127256]|uniref:helicase-associated domain-containing protein n=1 Tax=Cohnella sp. WQ 127256 TaxID=2938790 RepID=UPI00211768BE|nr:helicase-associated domain-containing protein [Cohnella sp. WQ 127256]
MNLTMSIKRLPDAIKLLIVSEPTIKSRSDQGLKLEEILSSHEWATTWVQRYGKSSCYHVLRGILIRFAAHPFEIKDLINSLEQTTAMTGAEIRISVAQLRRSGILFAVRKAWGDQLLYIPTDNVPLWQHLLVPVKGDALTDLVSREITFKPTPYRLPLSLELLSAWQAIHRQPFSWTTKGKGAIPRSSITRIAEEMRLTSEELSCLSLDYPFHEQLPSPVALAIDVGLCCKVLQKVGNEIRISDSELNNWISQSPMEADIRLHELVMDRYGAIQPVLHLTASVIFSLRTMEWYEEDQLQITSNQEESINKWLGLLEAFGWVERGICRNKAVFRKKIGLIGAQDVLLNLSDTIGLPAIFVQPDGEILVPPETGLRQRWVLNEIADRVTADAIFIYRMSPNACSRAFNRGYTNSFVVDFLQVESQYTLPGQVVQALEDWFKPLGKIYFAEVMLLRTDNKDVAEILKQDSEMAEKLIEQVGDRDFIIDAASYPKLRTRLQKIGLPPLDRTQEGSINDDNVEASHDEDGEEESGWVYRRHTLSMFESDRTLPDANELFPGVSDIPATWITTPRTYHSSTRKELILRAIAWQASIRMDHNGSAQAFVPKVVKDNGASWSVMGQWQIKLSNQDGENGNPSSRSDSVILEADEINEVMIFIPPLEELETV